jgi:molybdate transport repressor ModE-like protein
MPDNWRSVELKHLRALRAVAGTGTFWAAAEQLSESLSTVSDHIAALESLIGQRLIERSRGRRTVELTGAGRLLLVHTNAIESRLRAAEADFNAFAAGLSGTLRVGIFQSVSNKVLPEVLRRFKARWPDVDVALKEAGRDDELEVPIERGELDISFGVEPIPEGPFEIRRLMVDPYVLLVAAGSPMAGRRLTVADLKDAPMIGFQVGRSERLLEDFLLGRGVRPRMVFRSNDNGTVQGMVAAGIGVALAPLLAVDQSDPRVVLVELAEPVPPRTLVLLWHRDRYRLPTALAFIETAVAVGAEIERERSVSARGSRTRARSRRSRLPARRLARNSDSE